MLMNIFAATLLGAASASPIQDAPTFDVSNPVAYDAAHRSLALALRKEMQIKGAGAIAKTLTQEGHEMALHDICASCRSTFRKFDESETFIPGIWLFQPATARATHATPALIAFPAAGDEKMWSEVPALTLDGRWVSLDAHKAPDVPVFVIRINGKLSFSHQVEGINAKLQAAHLQSTTQSRSTASSASGHWTTRLESIRLNDDEEPWTSGAAEVYAITAGILPGNQAQVSIVDMPYLDYDGTTYYPRQVILDWTNYSYGAANILLYEHDDSTNYQSLVTALISAIGDAGSLAGYSEATAIAEIASRITSAMPSGWFSNDDDYVDSIYTVEKLESASSYGAAGNAFVSYIPYELPAN